MTHYMIFKFTGGMDPDITFYQDAPEKANSPEQAIRKAIRDKEGRNPDLEKAQYSEEQDYLAVPMNNWNTYHDKTKHY